MRNKQKRNKEKRRYCRIWLYKR